jgi:putative transposase
VFFTNDQHTGNSYISYMASSRRYECDYFTATILEWKHLLSNDLFKDIIEDSFRFLVREERVMIHAFVIMNNHMHVIWHILHPHQRDDVQRDMQKFTSQMMLKQMRNNYTELLPDFYVGARDRKYQIWERNPLSVPLWSEAVLKQKLEYLHNNRVRAGLCTLPEQYKYSTASIYNSGEDIFGFVTPIYL